jgi:hypothetical protein
LVERLLYTQDVGGSSPSPPTNFFRDANRVFLLPGSSSFESSSFQVAYEFFFFEVALQRWAHAQAMDKKNPDARSDQHGPWRVGIENECDCDAPD